MGALTDIQNELATLITALPIMGGSKAIVLEHGDLASISEAACNKYSGRTVVISLLGTPYDSSREAYNARIALHVWTRACDEAGKTSPVFYSDIVEDIIKALYDQRYPADNPDCNDVMRVTDGRLLTLGPELRAYTVYELTISPPFDLTTT